ncbi:MAG: DeoR/GlpR family DNA-binding transcription regulator [Pirellula sp.]|jgi:DeoR family fructose operon transcriptional repressor
MTNSSHQNPTLSRREKILEMLRQHGFVSILDLRDVLDVSESTIRRDLEYLEESGEAKRTHGGVFSTGPSNSVKQFGSRKGNWDLKRAVAILAAEQIEDHETILLDGGSTTYELARQLVGRPLQIVTNSLPVANLFASNDMVDLVFLGGFLHHKTGVTLGNYANEMLRSLNVQKAFLSVAGVNERGFYNSNGLLVETERTMMQCADRTIIVADSSKFGRSSLAMLCDWSRVHTLVSDEQLDPHWSKLAEQSQVILKIAAPSVIPPEYQSPTSLPNNVLSINNTLTTSSLS